MVAKAEQALASIAKLEKVYFKDRNPVHVWNAMVQIHFAYPILGRPFEFPPWVLGYLFNAAHLVGAAVTLEGGERLERMPSFIDTAKQRRDMVMRALRFSSGRGSNPIEQAHRDWERTRRLRHVEYWKSQGLSKKAAAKRAAEDIGELRMSADAPRKIRRDRQRLCGEG